ncbi:hypothetical protein SAMN05216420_10429 [Nitrosospira sp. Nl5]|uniref:hypothetical protein n=1 Tax=Nitrosospira sp. Nl5 TaxID=200120 RepID=UPI000885DC50|nr:hypothetical protein [Nitrosospira sp. Nl5]SCY26145.1 hypothetical protein SAMN05216420_10429 [Nitrosospira sp. Nl5]
MEADQLTDAQIANLTPEQIEMLENNPDKLGEILGKQAAKDEPEQEEQESQLGVTSSGAGEDEPVVQTKSGKGIIPYEKHKQLRVENLALREQLKAAQLENSQAAEKLEALLKQKENATGASVAEADDAIAKHLETIRKDMPDLHQVISAVLEGSRKQGETLNQTLEELRREKEESDRMKQFSVEEQVAEAKDNNPDLTHWESKDPEAWDEALKQDEILRTSGKWANKAYAERFQEVVRRVRAIMPEASVPQKQADPEQTKAEAQARLSSAPVRKPTTLSDIQGGANPASEREQLENLSPFELTQKLMKMSPQQASALRADLD